MEAIGTELLSDTVNSDGTSGGGVGRSLGVLNGSSRVIALGLSGISGEVAVLSSLTGCFIPGVAAIANTGLACSTGVVSERRFCFEWGFSLVAHETSGDN